MKPASAKEKGRRLQRHARQRILDTLLQLEEDDVKSTSMGAPGEDIHLSPVARKLFPFSVEAKNQEALNIWKALEQAYENAGKGHTPLVVFKRNHSKVYCALEFEDLLTLLYGKDETS